VALSAHDAFSAGRRRRRGGQRGTLSEINVTPLVDVMLVLLIVFMISAPLLTAGVPVDLPRTNAGAMGEQAEPVTVTIQANGAVFVGEAPSSVEALETQIRAVAGSTPAGEKPIYVRADGRAPYAAVARVMARLSTAGFTRVGLLTDTEAAAPRPAAPDARP